MCICLPMKDIIKESISLELDKIQAIIGPRRVRKTSAILLTIDLLKNHKIYLKR